MAQQTDKDIKKNFDNSFTRKFGFPVRRPVDKIVDELRDTHIEFIQQSPFCVMATADTSGRCDASPKGGLPGFVKVLNTRQILIPDVAGNRLFQSYQNTSENPHIGLIFFIPGVNETVRINGSVEIVSDQKLKELEIALEVQNPDEKAKVLQGMLITIDEAYGHCPRAFTFADLWDKDQIDENSGTPKKLND